MQFITMGRYGDFGAPGYDTGKDCPVPKGTGFMGTYVYEDVDRWCDCMYQDAQLNANCKLQFPRDGVQYVPMPWTAAGKAIRNLPGDILKQVLESMPPPARTDGPTKEIQPTTRTTDPGTSLRPLGTKLNLMDTHGITPAMGPTWQPGMFPQPQPKSNTGLILGIAGVAGLLLVLMSKKR